MPAAMPAVLGSLGAAVLLLVFLWGATGWACDVDAALHVALPFDSGHAHNSEQHAGLEGSLAQGRNCCKRLQSSAYLKDLSTALPRLNRLHRRAGARSPRLQRSARFKCSGQTLV